MRQSDPARRPLTVALLTETGVLGGAERMIVGLAEELRRRGHRVVPIVPRDEKRGVWLYDTLSARGFAPEAFHMTSPYDWRLFRQLASIIRQRQVDVLHSHEFYMGVAGGLVAKVLGRGHVITMHGSHYFAERKLRARALRFVAKLGDGIVGVSAATAKELHDVLGLGPDVVHRIDNGIAFEAGDAAAPRRELGLRDGEQLILSIGRLSPEKGHAVMVKALAELAASADGVPPWRAAIAGGGPEEAPVGALVESAGLGARVRLLGRREDVSSLHAAADIFVLPSLSEGLPLALLEAMNAGAAIVASDVGGIPEVVTHGETALLCPPGDPSALAATIRRLLGDPGERKRLGAAARRLVRERYDIAKMVDQYERLYRGND